MATKAKTHWQKQESRPVRPFRSAKDFLDDVGFRMYADEDFKTDEAIQTGDVELSKLALAIRVPAVALNFEEVVGVPTNLLRLVVTVEEFSQIWLPLRSFDWGDLLADYLGIAVLGSWVSQMQIFRRQL